jgi:hypothetical protein
VNDLDAVLSHPSKVIQLLTSSSDGEIKVAINRFAELNGYPLEDFMINRNIFHQVYHNAYAVRVLLGYLLTHSTLSLIFLYIYLINLYVFFFVLLEYLLIHLILPLIFYIFNKFIYMYVCVVL